MGAKVLDKDGKEVTLIMGSYGIGVERILTACIEQNHDDNGFWLAPSIAPFTVVVVPTNVKDATLVEASEKLAAELEAAGYDVLLDDRDERPGVKFKDADLVGIPYRINVGKKLAEGKVEVVERATSQCGGCGRGRYPDAFAGPVRSAGLGEIHEINFRAAAAAGGRLCDVQSAPGVLGDFKLGQMLNEQAMLTPTPQRASRRLRIPSRKRRVICDVRALAGADQGAAQPWRSGDHGRLHGPRRSADPSSWT